MALIVEDGSIVEGANSYVSLDEADTYFETHPYYSANWSDLNDDQKESFLIYATTTIENLFTWKGYASNLAQPLGWPRVSVYNKYGTPLTDNVIPNNLKMAQMELAVNAAAGDSFATSSSAGLDEVKIDVIELKFSSSSTSGAGPVPSYALSLLSDLGVYSAGSRVIRAVPG